MQCKRPDLAPSTASSHHGCKCQRCKDWRNEYIRKYQAQRTAYNREYRKRTGKDKQYNVAHKYGLTVKEYDAMLKKGCALCPGRGPLGVDHDHETGVVRGVLCRACNNGLGLLGDSVAGLKAALAYLASGAYKTCKGEA